MTRWMLCGAALMMALAQAARATPITVANADFEDPILAAGAYFQITSGSVPNWSANDPNIYVLKGAEFGLGATASNVAFLEPNANPSVATQIVYQVLGEIVRAGTYKLTVDAGHSTSYGSVDVATDAIIGFGHFNPDTSSYAELQVDTVASSLMPNGSLSSISMTMNISSGSAYLGESLVVVLASPYQSAGMCNVSFDNVSVDYVGIPEPSSLTLVAAGIAGLLCYAWRKRR